MTALREPEAARKGVTAMRALVSAALGLGAWQIASSLFGAELRALSNSLFLPLLMVATLVPVAPAALSALMAAWTAPVPQRRLHAWYLARRTARYGLAASTSTETPIMVGFALVAGIFSLGGLLEGYIRQQGLTGYSAVSYTHLDVYKRQALCPVPLRPSYRLRPRWQPALPAS